MRPYWKGDRLRTDKTPYKPQPELNRTFTPEGAAAIKRRQAEVRRAIEDREIDKELEIA